MYFAENENLMKPAILIAERDPDLCDFYQRFLSKRGYLAETAADGLDCLKKARTLKPDVLVLDLELHWGGGDGVLAWLREESALSTVAVILTASGAAPQHLIEDVETPVVKFLPKPFALADLLESVRAAVAERRNETFHSTAPACSELFIG
jgi:DNA-binding response OmpR family regulator